MIKNNGILIEITSPNGDTFNVATTDLLSAIASSVGPQHWLDDLINAHLKLSHSLHNQNFGDVGTEAYDPTNPEAGKQLEELAGAIAQSLQTLKRSSKKDGET